MTIINTEFLIQEVNINDVKFQQKIIDIQKDIWNDPEINHKMINEKEYINNIISLFNKGLMFGYIAKKNKIIAGLILAIIHEGKFLQAKIKLLWVHQKWQRMGIANNLIDCVEKKCIEKKIQSLTLKVSLNNDKAKALYLKKGFETHRLSLKKII